ncbi:hypothetical protein IV203_030230 [Nitzschia inconspicua]|uniref:Digalactosyldiacylglycerol synthase n=1 Tax=Nitzschia inconspicua TaxID=303405 RepID=A0A9K3Q411_9STRA|nr:hypothetical protein IV203_030230 [Nitzschia inconspicua]
MTTSVGKFLLRVVVLATICRLVVVVVSSSQYYQSESQCLSQVLHLHGGAASAAAAAAAAAATTSTARDTIDNRTEKDIATNTNLNVSSSSSTIIDDVALDLMSTTTTTEEQEDDVEDDDDDDDNGSNNHQDAKRRKKFLNRIAKVSSLLLRREHDASLEEEGDELEMHDPEWGNEVTPQSDLQRPGRHVHIVTTASLPWFTGTAVNPLLRAAYLHRRLKVINSHANVTTTTNTSSYVTLIIPWLELPEDQEKVYNGHVFQSPNEQEAYVRDWLRNQAEMPDAAEELNLHFYNARYHAGLGSVFAMGDIIQQLPQNELDVCVLEEPEHVNWFRAPGQGWTKRYNYVVGIVHTNYDQYATQHYSGLWTAPAIRLMSAAMVRAYCHKVIKLSDIVQIFAPEKEVTMNVHGVREEFIAAPNTQPEFTEIPLTSGNYSHSIDQAQVYFIGKLLWTKGLDLLLDYQEYYRQVTGEYFPVEIYGSGPDKEEMVRAYLGRWTRYDNENVKKGIEKASKNVFVRLFAWLNKRRRIGWKRQARKTSVTVEDLYNDVMEVIESMPDKTRESIEQFPSQARDTYDQLAEDVTKAKKSVKRLPAKARRALNQLVQDLSNTPIPRSLYELRKQPIPAGFPGRVDHAELKNRHKVFVNPSVSEVLCTTTAEALAMNKFAIIPLHPSNQFFLQFPNCLAYRNPYEFVANLQWALTHDPVPLTEDLARQFTWEAATDRFLQSAAITHREAREREKLGKSKMDERIAWFHNELGKGAKGDIIRNIFGAGPVANQVKYSISNQKDGARGDGEEEDDDEEEEDEGLSRKFHDSAFVKALREAFETGISTAIE